MKHSLRPVSASNRKHCRTQAHTLSRWHARTHTHTHTHFGRQVDVALEDVAAAKERVMGAIFPRATQMDFNIGAALWLAAPASCLYASHVLMYASASYVCMRAALWLATGSNRYRSRALYVVYALTKTHISHIYLCHVLPPTHTHTYAYTGSAHVCVYVCVHMRMCVCVCAYTGSAHEPLAPSTSCRLRTPHRPRPRPRLLLEWNRVRLGALSAIHVA